MRNRTLSSDETEQEKLHLVRFCYVDRQFAVVVDGGDISTFFDQETCNALEAARGRRVQRGPALVVASVHVCTSFHQELDHLQIVIDARLKTCLVIC
jgi:hypothetical protein